MSAKYGECLACGNITGGEEYELCARCAGSPASPAPTEPVTPTDGERTFAESIANVIARKFAYTFSEGIDDAADLIAAHLARTRAEALEEAARDMAQALDGIMGFLGVLANGQTVCATKHAVAQRYYDAINSVLTRAAKGGR